MYELTSLCGAVDFCKELGFLFLLAYELHFSNNIV